MSRILRTVGIVIAAAAFLAPAAQAADEAQLRALVEHVACAHIDVNMDGKVGLPDRGAAAQAFKECMGKTTSGKPNCEMIDVTRDGVVGIDDAGIWDKWTAKYMGKDC